MGTNISQEIIANVASHTLEEVAFIFSEASKQPIPWRDGALLMSTLSFSGSRSGWVMIATSEKLACHMAANLLGIEPSDSEAQMLGRDALGEVLNIIGGVLLGELDGYDKINQLTPPKVSPATNDLIEEQQRRARSSVSLISEDDDRIDLAVWIAD
jgi:CheY-specific phosphatase CheX